MWSNRIIAALLVIAILTGITFGYFGRAMFAFSTKGELDINDFYKLIIGLLVALYIGESVKSRSADRRREKDILLERIDDLVRAYRAIVSDFQNIFDKDSDILPKERTALSRQFKLASANLTTLENLFPRSRAPKRCSAIVKDIREAEMKFKKIVTGSSARFAPTDLPDGANAQRLLEERLLRLEIEINVAP